MEVVSLAELRRAVTAEMALASARAAFSALANGSVRQPPVAQLIFPEREGDVCIKAGHLGPGSPYYCVKIAGGFYANARDDPPAPSGSGALLLGSARTGRVEAVLADDGWLTDLRTAAAGALAASLLAPGPAPGRDGEGLVLAVLGSGVQARMQTEMICRVRKVRAVRVWSRTRAHADRLVQSFAGGAELPGRVSEAASCATAAEALLGAECVVTTTPSHAPLFSLEDLQRAGAGRGVTVIAVGSDTPGKQEIPSEAIAHAIAAGGKIVGDKREQVLALGEMQHAPDGAADAIVELGDVLIGREKGREADELILCDLTGCGAQDAAIAAEALTAWRDAGATGGAPRA